MEDTEQEDSVGELFWKEAYKKILREALPGAILSEIAEDTGFQAIYEALYSDTLSSFEAFTRSLANIIEIGCENGADMAFDEIYYAFRNHQSLLRTPRYYRYLWPEIPPLEILQRVKDSVVSEYAGEKSYLADFDDFYSKIYPAFSTFLNEVAELVVIGLINGADETVYRVYRSFVLKLPLPVARRRPRRLKGW